MIWANAAAGGNVSPKTIAMSSWVIVRILSPRCMRDWAYRASRSQAAYLKPTGSAMLSLQAEKRFTGQCCCRKIAPVSTYESRDLGCESINFWVGAGEKGKSVRAICKGRDDWAKTPRKRVCTYGSAGAPAGN